MRAEGIARREQSAGKQIEIEPRYQEILASDAAGDPVLTDERRAGCLVELNGVAPTPAMPSKLLPTLWLMGLVL